MAGKPYSGDMGAGVSLRLQGVQVVKLEPMKARSPFSAVDGFDSKEGNVFAQSQPDSTEVEEPKKVVKKSSPKPDDNDDLSSIVDDWDD